MTLAIVGPMGHVLTHAPLGILILDTEGNIASTNAHGGRLLACQDGDPISQFVHPDSTDAFQRVLETPHEAIEIRLALGGVSTKVVDAISLPPDSDAQVLFLTDISEKIALGRQLRSSRQPSQRILHQLQTANTTMMGYAELIAIMLEEEANVTGERLAVIRRYQIEMRKCIESVDRLLKIERHGGRRPDAAAIPINRRHIVVVDDERAIAAFISELMRGMRHRVTTFSDPLAAEQFCTEHSDTIDLIITDQRMPQLSGEQLAARIHRSQPQLPVVLCSDQNLSVDESQLIYLCQKPIDINELTRLVNELA